MTDIQQSLPLDLQTLIAGADWHENQIGWSGVRVFRLLYPDGTACYLKVAAPPHDLIPEMLRLQWLQGRLPVPELLYFADDPAQQVLLMSEIPGLVAFDDQFQTQRGRIIELLAEGLRQIHSIGIADCPFDNQIGALIKQARLRVFEGRVDESQFDPVRQGRAAHDLLVEILATRPAHEDMVFTHGDYCLPNVLIDPAALTISGFIDWGHAGIADRYADLALVVRSIMHNFGESWVAPFWDAYGIPEIDQAKVAFFQLLDELF